VGVIVDSVMRKPVATIEPDATLRDAALLMKEKRVGSLVVVHRGKPIGIVTERDLVHRVVADGLDAHATPVKDVMSFPVETIEASADLEQAVALMRQRGYKRLVVMVGDEMRGVVTVTDIAHAKPELTRRFIDGWVKARWED